MSYYDSDRALGEYLLFHYGDAAEVMPWPGGPQSALGYPVRCVSECLDLRRLPPAGRALDLGCAVGRSTFELARHCAEVLGIDFSQRFIAAAQHLRNHGSLSYAYTEEGDIAQPTIARVPEEIVRERVQFEWGDAQALRSGLGEFDVVLLANLLDRLREPRRCLAALPALVRAGGQLILSTPCTWLAEYTPESNWLGGFVREGRPVRTLDTLCQVLSPDFELIQTRDLAFLIREHARKFQWSVAQASVWVRRE